MNKLYLTILLFAVAAISLFWSIPDKYLHVYFLDVGQGDSIFIKTPLNHSIIIDGGPDTSLLDRLYKIMPTFEHEIDLIVLSHPHSDHVYGFLDLLKRYKVNAVLMTGVNYKSYDYEYFLDFIDESKTKIYFSSSNQDFLFDNSVFLNVLYPANPSISKTAENVNNDSIVLKLVYGNNSIIFTGDSEKEAEADMLKSPFDYDADILKVGHHGSRTATSDIFLKSVSPKYTVISVGEGNSFKHPHEETIEKLTDLKTYRTDLDGTVEFIFDQKGIISIKPQF